MTPLWRRASAPAGQWPYFVASLLSALVLLGTPHLAHANPRMLPFSYPWETLAKGSVEVEQFVDVIPLRVYEAPSSKTTIIEPRFELTTEFEYGITDRLELGLYLAMKNNPEEAGAGAPLVFDGIKQRLRYRFLDENELPLDLSLYLEIAEMRDAIEIEEKVNLQKRVGRLKAVVNLWVEQELPRGEAAVLTLHPTAGLTYQISPNFSLGAEYWMQAQLDLGTSEARPKGSVEAENHDPHHFFGPCFALVWDKLWWTVGLYGRIDDFGRTMRPGESLGNSYFRTIIGLPL